jgi:hypothetical protein
MRHIPPLPVLDTSPVGGKKGKKNVMPLSRMLPPVSGIIHPPLSSAMTAIRKLALHPEHCLECRAPMPSRPAVTPLSSFNP